MLNYPSKRAAQRSWEELYQDLCKFKNEHGHCKVPLKGGDTGLGLWVSKQKNNKSTLTKDQIDCLNNLDFEWETRKQRDERVWFERLEQLKEYRKRNGTFRVNRVTHRQLGAWTDHQKSKQANGTLNKDRELLLNQIGFEWKSPDQIQKMKESKQQTLSAKKQQHNATWYKHYMKLVEFHKQNGHCIVPFHYSKDKALGCWVKTQRQKYKSNELSNDRYIELQNLGFVWSVDKNDANSSINQRKWDERFQLLKEYKSKFGTVDISRSVVYNDYKLGAWLRNQKAETSLGTMSNNTRRLQLLKELGVIFQPRQKWDNYFVKLSEYYKANGHCKLPQNYEDKSLVRWVEKQSNLAKLGEITRIQKEKLDSINFQFVHGVADTCVDKIPLRKSERGSVVNISVEATSSEQQQQQQIKEEEMKDDDHDGMKMNQQKQQSDTTTDNDYFGNDERTTTLQNKIEEEDESEGGNDRILNQDTTKQEDVDDPVCRASDDENENENRCNLTSSSSTFRSGISTQNEDKEKWEFNVKINKQKKEHPSSKNATITKKKRKRNDDDDDNDDSDDKDSSSNTQKKKKSKKQKTTEENIFVTTTEGVTTRDPKKKKKKKDKQEQQKEDSSDDLKKSYSSEECTKETKKRKKAEKKDKLKREALVEESPKKKSKQEVVSDRDMTLSETNTKESKKKKKKHVSKSEALEESVLEKSPKQQKHETDEDLESSKMDKNNHSKSSSRTTSRSKLSFESFLSSLVDASSQQTDQHSKISKSIKKAMKNLSTKPPIRAKKFHKKIDKQLDLPMNAKSKIVEKCKALIREEFVDKSQLLHVVVDNDETIYITESAVV